MSQVGSREFERILWIVFAALAWKFALHAEAVGLPRDSVATIVLFVSGYGLGLCALVMAMYPRSRLALRGATAFAFFAFFVLSFAVTDALARSHSPYSHTTDAHAYMDYAARLFIHGRNPYSESLYGAYSLHLLPSDLQTPLRNGGLSDRLAYPSLSFLVLVPFVAAGIDTRLVYALGFVGCVALLYVKTPKELRALALLPFLANEDFLAFCLGGVTDSIWALFLCAAVVTWKRKWAPAVFFALACAYKQHAWLIGPFLAARLWRETAPEERRGVLLRFFGVAVVLPLALNLPFILWQPMDWLKGIGESLAGDMVPLGEGFSAVISSTGLGLPKRAFTILFWGMYFGLAFVCARFRVHKSLVWIAPSIAFFFNYRSLSSYWYFNFFPFAVELVSSAADEEGEGRTLRPGLIVAAGAAVCAIIGGAFLYARAHVHDLRLELSSPIRTWGGNATRIDLRLANDTAKTITPRFWLQGRNFQALPWRVDKGPADLPPGASAQFSISALHRASEFDVMEGARVTVTDINSDVRVTTVVEPDPSWASPSAIQNGGFRFWDVSGGGPTFWEVEEEGSAGAAAAPDTERAGVILSIDPDEGARLASRLQFCRAIPTCYSASHAGPHGRATDASAQDHAVHISTETAFHDGVLGVWALPPDGANRAPDFDERYGVDLRIGDERVLVMLGGEPAEGTLPSGVRFTVLAGPRNAWSRYALDLGALKARFAPRAYPGAGIVPRAPLSDVPMIPVRLSLSYASRTKVRGAAHFGAIEDGISGKIEPAKAYDELEAHRGQVDAFRASYELYLRNPTRAQGYMQRALREESHPTLVLRAAQLALEHGDLVEAQREFTEAMAFSPIEGMLGRGWAEFFSHDVVAARRDFAAVLDALAEAGRSRVEGLTGEQELKRMNASVGLALSLAVAGDCAAAERALATLPPAEINEAHGLPELATCIASRDAGAPSSPH